MEQTIWVCNQCDKFCGAVDEASHVAIMRDKFCIGCDGVTDQTATSVNFVVAYRDHGGATYGESTARSV